MPLVLLNRTEHENQRLAKELYKLGIDTIFCPQIIRQALEFNISDYQDYKNIIISSKFAAEILSPLIFWPANCYVVGKKSAEILRSNKFIKSVQHFNNISELPLSAGAIYFCGDNITQNLPVKQVIIYHTIYKPFLSEQSKDMLLNRKIDAILIFSLRTAQSFITALKEQNLLDSLTNVAIVALSKKIALEFVNLSSKILYCDIPSEEEMLKLLLGSIKNKVYDI